MMEAVRTSETSVNNHFTRQYIPEDNSEPRWEDGIRMDLREIDLGGCGLDSTGSGQGPMAGCCVCGDEPSGSCATELVGWLVGL
jgi:hypothetical protein